MKKPVLAGNWANQNKQNLEFLFFKANLKSAAIDISLIRSLLHHSPVPRNKAKQLYIKKTQNQWEDTGTASCQREEIS